MNFIRYLFFLFIILINNNLFSKDIEIYQNFFFFEEKDPINYNFSNFNKDYKYAYFKISDNNDTEIYFKINKKIHHFREFKLNTVHKFDELKIKIDSRELSFNDLLNSSKIEFDQKFFLNQNFKVFEKIDYLKLIKKNNEDYINELINNNLLEVSFRYLDDSIKERFNNVHEKPEEIFSSKFYFFLFFSLIYIFFILQLHNLKRKLSFFLLLINVLFTASLAYYQFTISLFIINLIFLIFYLLSLRNVEENKFDIRHAFLINYSYILVISLSLTNKSWCQDGCATSHLSSLILFFIILESFIYKELKLYKFDIYKFLIDLFRKTMNYKIVNFFDYDIFSHSFNQFMPSTKKNNINKQVNTLDPKIELRLFIIKLLIGLGSTSVVLIIIFWIFFYPMISVFNNADMILKKVLNSGDMIFNNLSNNQAEIKRKLDVIVLDLKSTNPETKQEFLENIKYLFNEWFYPIIEDKVDEISNKD